MPVWLRSSEPSYEMMNIETTTSQLSVASKQRSWWDRHMKGWKFGILAGACLAFLVLSLNLAVTIYGDIGSKGAGTTGNLLFSGDCDQVSRYNLAIHLGINILGTLLLSASNYSMQCLSAPTRKEIDVAHASKIWLDIGVMSIKNLSQISRRRVVLWVLLGLTSLPLHLFYNSAIYSSIYSYEYYAVQTTESLLNASNSTMFIAQLNYASANDNLTMSHLWASNQAKNLTRLSVSDCQRAYAVNFQTSYRNLLLVAQDETAPTTLKNIDSTNWLGNYNPGCSPDPFSWLCGDSSTWACSDASGLDPEPCTLNRLNTTNWSPMGSSIQYCLAEQVSQKCEIQFVPLIAYIIIAFNIAKVLILSCTFFLISENPIMTIGDAIASFLRFHDETTAGLCLMGKDNINWWQSDIRQPQPLSVSTKKWASVVSKRRWRILMLLFVLILGVCITLFILSLTRSGFSAATMMSIKIGTTDPRTFIYWDLPFFGLKALISNVLVANAPQLILSMIYYTYNGLLTCFLLGQEWNNFEQYRKGLRVTTPEVNFQRSSYTLQLPKRWALPLLGLSALLHWLTSQSISLVSVHSDRSSYKWQNDELSGDDLSNEFISCAFNSQAILATTCIGIAMIAFVVLLGQRNFKFHSIPVVGSCSAAVSAACQNPTSQTLGNQTAQVMGASNQYVKTKSAMLDRISDERNYDTRYHDHGYGLTPGSSTSYLGANLENGNEDEDFGLAAELPVKWGAFTTSVEVENSADDHGMTNRSVGKCGFSSKLVDTPIAGRYYM